jgi:hypothetical protein
VFVSIVFLIVETPNFIIFDKKYLAFIKIKFEVISRVTFYVDNQKENKRPRGHIAHLSHIG